jgi:hypothetical protein
MSRGGEHAAAPLEFTTFEPTTFPSGVARSDAVDYLRCYLADLDAQSIIEEPNYFDRDYLAEFSAFYSTSSRGYSNACRRLHLFSLPVADVRTKFDSALSGSTASLGELQNGYLGFVVIRPISATPLGRTVLRWYPDARPGIPRVTSPAREYIAHLAGLPLRVTGLAWQQQDSGVGACATVALWTMFHSSARDEHHAVPTTVEITRSAKTHWPHTRRIFPAADGLVVDQLCHAIKAQGLLPVVLEGDEEVLHDAETLRAFSRTRFAASCAALIRSGYPALIAAHAIENGGHLAGGHAVCAVGFRPGPTPKGSGAEALEADGSIEHLYINDDNLGPSVRFAVTEDQSRTPPVALLAAAPPPPLRRSPNLPNPTEKYLKLIPFSIVAALPEEIRMDSDYLNAQALDVASVLATYLSRRAKGAASTPTVTFSSGFFRLREYLGAELERRVSGAPLGNARRALVDEVRPMSLHLGVVRIGVDGVPLLDVLFDTTDSEPATDAFAHVVFQPFPTSWLRRLGTPISAF